MILLVDMRHPASPLDVQMAEFLLARELPFLVLLTKSDKLNKTETARRMEDIRRELPGGEDLTILPFSSQTGAGADEFRGILQSLCGV